MHKIGTQDYKQDLLDAIQAARTAFAERGLPLPVSMVFPDEYGDFQRHIKKNFRTHDFTIDPHGPPFDFEKGVKIIGMNIKIVESVYAQD